MLKFGVPLVITFVILLLSITVTSYFTLRLNFSKVFKTTVQSAPTPETGGLSIRLQGIEGDSAIVGFQFRNSTSSSEEILFTGKNFKEIESGLDQIETNRWEFLTNLPSAVFRFNVSVISYPNSPNNAKKASYFLIEDSNGATYKVLPGDSLTFSRDVKINNLPTIISALNIKLIYENGMYQNFYDVNGKLVSQATGELVVKPTPWTQFLIILGVWTFVVGLLVLLKETLLSSQGLIDVLKFLKSP